MIEPDRTILEPRAPHARRQPADRRQQLWQDRVGGLLYRANHRLESFWAGLEQQTLEISGNRWNYYFRHPRAPQGAYTVLLHGFTAEAGHWFRFARRLDCDQGLIIPDLPGFGQSTPSPDASYAIPEQTRRLASFLDILGSPGPLHLVGSSMGGQIALEYTLQQPERVASLTLIGSGGVVSPQPSAAAVETSRGAPSPFAVGNREAFSEFLRYCMRRPPWMPALVRNYLAGSFIARNAHHQSILPQILFTDLRDTQLDRIKVPTLIVWGEEDRLLHRSMAASFRAGIGGSECCLMRGIGHLPFVEAPGWTARIYQEFLRRRVMQSG